MINRGVIKHFVQDILGCGCPEDVFRIIESESDIKMDNTVIKNKINIGNRLLIYIVESDGVNLNSLIPLLIKYGKKERDDRGFNRLRIVLVFKEVNKIKDEAVRIFNDYNSDEKIHLHLFEKEKIPPFEN